MTSIRSREKWVFDATNSNPIMSKTRNIFSVFLLNFWNLHQIFDILKRKDEIIGDLFPKLQTAKCVIT